MRKPSGQLHVVDHSTEQIVAVLQPNDYRDDLRHWEIKNNIDRLEFKVFTSLPAAATLMQQNLILRETRDGRIIPYTIDEAIQTTDKRSIHVYASAVWVEIAQANYIRPQKIQSKTVNEFMDMALAGTKWKRGFTEYSGFHTMTIDTFIDPLKFLKDIASLFHLEIQYRVEVLGSQIVGWYVDMIQRRGKDEGKEITLGKDLIGIKRIENTRNICTALVGFVKGEGDSVITIESINKGLPYIVDTQAFQLWNKQGFHRFGLYTPETENQNMTPQRLKTLMEIEIKKRRNAAVTYEVEAQSINRVFGFDHESIFEGDTIRIKDKGFKPKLYLEARAIAGDESYKNPLQDRYMFGDYREIVDPNEELRKIYNRILSSLGDKQEMINQLDKLVKEANETASNAKIESEAAKTLAEKVQENIKNNTVEIIESKYPPTTGLKDRKTLWLDISNGKPGILKLWKDGIWDPVVPDVESVKKATLEQVSKDIESTKTELNKKVQIAEEKAEEISGQIIEVKKELNTKVDGVQKETQVIAGQIANVTKEVQNKVDQNWVNEQIKDKADKAGVYTKDEIKDGFIGKQVYETDKQGNVQKFRDINTSIGQTNEALTQKAEKSELKKTNEGLSQLEQKTNEIKTTADGTKQTLTELKTKVDNTKIGGRNLLKDSVILNNSWDSDTVANISRTILSDAEGRYLQAKITTVNTSRVSNFYYFTAPNWTKALEKGKEYVLSVDAMATIDGCIFKIRDDKANKYFSTRIPKSTTYQRISFTLKYDGDFTNILIIGDIPTTAKVGDYVNLRNFKLEEGNVPTDYSLAPEDQVTTNDFTKKTVEIEATIKGINTTVSNVQNEQGKLTERVTKSEQTADGFKTSIESLNKKDTAISNKLNTVESTVEGTKKTISDIQSNTASLKQTTTEIKEQAGKISEKLTSVEQKYDDMKIGGQNFYKQKSFGAAGGTTVKYDKNNKWWDITIPAGASGSWKGILYNNKNAKLLVGRAYTISYEIYADEVIPTAIDINNYGVATSTGTNDNDVVAKRIMRTPKTIAGQWVKVSATFIMPDNITQDFYDNSVIGVGNGWTPTKITNIKIRNMQLEEGNIPTSYRIPSEDQVTTDEFTKKTTEIEKSVEGIKTTVSSVKNLQGALESRVTTQEQTANSFKQSIETLNKKDAEISNKINTVESTVEGTKKTISDVQQTTNDLKKTTTDIKEEAGKISTKLEQVEARTVGGENWLINTGPNEKPQTIGMVGGAQVNKAKFAVQPGEYIVLECSDHTDSFYQFHLDNTKMGDFEKSKDMTLSLDLQNDVHVDFILFQFINGVWSGTVQKGVPASNVWKREVWTFNIDTRATGWGLRLRFARNTNSIGKRFRFKKPKLEKGSIPTDFSKSTYELEQSMDGVKTTVTNVQNSQAGFEKRMSNVEQTASGLSSTVSNLNNVVSDQGKKLTEANTKLEQQATAINAKVALKQVEDYVAGFKIPDLKQTVNQNKQDLLDELANKLATEQFNQKMTLIDNRFTINEQGINAAAKKTEVYTKLQADGQFAKDSYVRDLEGRIQITEKNILSTVKKGDIISSINQSAEKIKISAALIDLVGKVEASWLKAGLLIGMTIKTSNSTEHLHMENQVVRFVNQGSDKMVIGFENERKSKTRNPYIILGEGDGSGKNFGSIYKDGNGVYYRYVDLNGAESNIRLTNAGNIGITAQDGFWVNSKRANFNSTIEVPAIRFTSLGKTPGSQQGNFWIGNGYKGFGIYYYDNYWKFVQGS
ncbi:TPA: phage tail spike protein [Bacillus anthracis]